MWTTPKSAIPLHRKLIVKKVQQALTNLECWSRDNNFDFNSSKCKVLTITRKKSPLIYTYQMNSTVLSRVEKQKDLGVCVNKNLSWNDYICTWASEKNLSSLDRHNCKTSIVLDFC